MKRSGILLLLFLSGACLAAVARPDWQTISHEGRTRRYLVLAPTPSDAGPSPMVLVLHGGGGSARQVARSDFGRLASMGFLVVCPEGLERHWNDGRRDPKFDDKVDDVGFLEAVIDQVAQRHAVQPGQVYATGISNGAMMCHRLALERSGRVAAIAPVVGGVPVELAESFPAAGPVSVLIIQGTADPLVPYRGGEVGVFGLRRGSVLSTDRAVELWRQSNQCSKEPIRVSLPDLRDDGCRVERWDWEGVRADVALVRVEGGGHTLPGGDPYLPARVVGKVCQDFDGVEMIADFFRAHPPVDRAGRGF